MVFVLLGSAIALCILIGILYQYLGSRSDTKRFPAPGQLVDLGGYNLHLFQLGSGSPTVVLESGISASSLNWRTVQGEAAKFTRVCSYERSGLGWSELCDHPCTPGSLAAQLHKLLTTAALPPPYILVGHSFGALIVRAFAAQHPMQTAAVILVDPLDPAEWNPITDEQRRTIARGVRLSRRGATAARFGISRLFLSLLLRGNRLLPQAAATTWSGRESSVTNRIAEQVGKMPQDTWPLVAAHWKQAKCFEGMARHIECLPKSIHEMADAAPISVSVTMLVGTQNEHPADPLQYAKRISQDTKVIFANKSGHWIQLDEPELVVESIREAVERARRLQSALVRQS